MLDTVRERYVVGLHLNWHDDAFRPPRQFDFFMAGPEDLRPVDDTPYRLIPMDACNFTPSAYRPFPSDEKFWDVLAVGNPVFFKRPEVVLKTIRRLFDASARPLKVIYICPMPTRRLLDEDTAFYDVRRYYEAMFSAEEQSRFTLLTTNFNSPNPFDRNTLSVFFRNSRVFLHCPTEERRCRIAAYAWCAGLPVVAYPSVGSILPPTLRRAPGYYEIERDEDYVSNLLEALDKAPSYEPAAYRRELSETETVSKLAAELAAVYEDLGMALDGPLLARNLDRRLGWHHGGIGGTANGLSQPLDAFMTLLCEFHERPTASRQALFDSEYPEKLLAGSGGHSTRETTSEVERGSFYLNPARRRWIRLLKAVRAKVGLH